MRSSHKTTKAASFDQAPNKLRIIGGCWRRQLLDIAPVHGLRPTPDRVRETVFNWLGQTCTDWSVLDLFSGTGALGLEAASRGAAQVLFIEKNRQIANTLQTNIGTLLSRWSNDWGSAPALRVECADVRARCAQLVASQQKFDLVCLDPPFDGEQLHELWEHLHQLLSPHAVLYVEWGQMLSESGHLRLLRHLKAGKVHAHLFCLV